MIEEKTGVRTIVREFAKAFSRLTPEERAYKVVRGFFKVEQPTDAMKKKFTDWLQDEQHREAKQQAMERIAREHFNGEKGFKKNSDLKSSENVSVFYERTRHK